MKISVLGSGRWASFLAWYLTKRKNEVCICGRAESAKFNYLKENKQNEYLKMPDELEYTSDLCYAVERAEIIIISISSQSLRSFIKDVVKIGLHDKKIVLCMKGLESNSGKRLTEVVIEEGVNKENVAIWVGPGHIQEFAQGKPNCMVIDSPNHNLTKYLADSFKSKLIRFYYGNDLIGSEIGAASKNVMGIAAGMLDGGGFETLKGALMARGAREVARLIRAMNGNELSAYGLCHLGDYETTLFSPYSNNRKFGESFVLNKSFEKLAEGVDTSKAMKILGDKYGEELPITSAVYNTIFLKNDCMNELLNLFTRIPRNEFY